MFGKFGTAGIIHNVFRSRFVLIFKRLLVAVNHSQRAAAAVKRKNVHFRLIAVFPGMAQNPRRLPRQQHIAQAKDNQIVAKLNRFIDNSVKPLVGHLRVPLFAFRQKGFQFIDFQTGGRRLKRLEQQRFNIG